MNRPNIFIRMTNAHGDVVCEVSVQAQHVNEQMHKETIRLVNTLLKGDPLKDGVVALEALP